MPALEACAGCPVIEECNDLIAELESGRTKITLKNPEDFFGLTPADVALSRGKVILSVCDQEGPETVTGPNGEVIMTRCRSEAPLPDDVRTRVAGD